MAAARSLPVLLAEGLHARGLFLPDELDPDEYVAKYGVAELRKHLSSAPDLFELVSTQAWLKAKGQPSGKIQLIDEFAPVLAACADTRMRSLYIDGFANMLDIDRRLVEQSVKKALAGGTKSVPVAPVGGTNRPIAARPAVPEPEALSPEQAAEPKKRPQIELNKVTRAEIDLLNVILMKEVYLKEALKSDVGDKFANEGAGQVYQRIVEVYGLMPSKFDTLTALLVGEVKSVEVITRHLSEPFTSLNDEAAIKLVQDCVRRIKENNLRMKSKELVSTLRAGSSNPSDQLEQIMNIHKNRRSLTRDS